MSALDSSILVIGTQLSGTALRCRLLSAHPNILIQIELNVRKMFAPEWAWDDITRAIKRLICEDHGRVLDTTMDEANESYWGLKDLELAAHLEDMGKCLPESKLSLSSGGLKVLLLML